MSDQLDRLEKLLVERLREQDEGLMLTADLLAYRLYVEDNLERLREGWVPLCFEEFVGSEERWTFADHQKKDDSEN